MRDAQPKAQFQTKAAKLDQIRSDQISSCSSMVVVGHSSIIHGCIHSSPPEPRRPTHVPCIHTSDRSKRERRWRKKLVRNIYVSKCWNKRSKHHAHTDRRPLVHRSSTTNSRRFTTRMPACACLHHITARASKCMLANKVFIHLIGIPCHIILSLTIRRSIQLLAANASRSEI